MKNNNFSRRNFLKTSAITTGLTAISPLAFTNNPQVLEPSTGRLPREVWIAGISQMGLQTQTPQQMVRELIRIVEDVSVYQPDIICLPETFPTANVTEKNTLEEKLEISDKALQQFSALAKKHNCYIICPVYTSGEGKAYNSAVIFSRDGSRLGEYRKIYLTDYEIEDGLTPGPILPPIFQTDFGKIGIQICFDIQWDEGWAKLRGQGAEIVFWPSAFAGGQMINTKAWQHKYVVASSVRNETSKICDILGEVIAQTGFCDKNFYCAPVNLEKAFIHTWPFNRHFGDIKKKYGRKVKITTFHQELWSVIESLSPEVFVADILKEFDIRTLEQYILDAEIIQIKARKG